MSTRSSKNANRGGQYAYYFNYVEMNSDVESYFLLHYTKYTYIAGIGSDNYYCNIFCLNTNYSLHWESYPSLLNDL